MRQGVAHFEGVPLAVSCMESRLWSAMLLAWPWVPLTEGCLSEYPDVLPLLIRCVNLYFLTKLLNHTESIKKCLLHTFYFPFVYCHNPLVYFFSFSALSWRVVDLKKN